MELRHIRCFVMVAEELHFTRAAARLQIAQPAVSHHVRRLERELGAQLFVRTHTAVQLTDTGRVILEHARRVLDEADLTRQAAQQATQGDLGRLTIGYVSQTVADPLPELLAAYRSRHPRVDIELRKLDHPDLIDALTASEINIGLTYHRVGEPHLRTLLFRRERLVVAMSASHRLAKRSTLRLRELADERWIHSGSQPSSPWLAACAKAGFEPLMSTQRETDTTARMVLVAAGFGLAIRVESEPRVLSQHIVYRPLEGPRVTTDLIAAWNKDRTSPLTDGFLDITRIAAKQARPGSQTTRAATD